MHTSLRMALVRVECEVLELATQSSALEACLSVRHDGLPLREVAELSGRPVSAFSSFVADLPQPWRPSALSACPGTLLKPLEMSQCFLLCQIQAKSESSLADPEVCHRVDQALLRQEFTELTARHVRWHITLGPE